MESVGLTADIDFINRPSIVRISEADQTTRAARQAENDTGKLERIYPSYGGYGISTSDPYL